MTLSSENATRDRAGPNWPRESGRGETCTDRVKQRERLKTKSGSLKKALRFMNREWAKAVGN